MKSYQIREIHKSVSSVIQTIRVMAMTYEDVDYDQYDGCIQSPAPRSKETISYAKPAFLIYPNPSSGLINLEFVNSFSGEISVFNNIGSLIFQSKVFNQKTFTLDLRNNLGLNLIKIENENGHIEFNKVIVSK